MSNARKFIKGFVRDAITRKPHFANSIAVANFHNVAHKVRTVEIELSSAVPLGQAGDRIFVPVDEVILPEILTKGEWEPQSLNQIVSAMSNEVEYDLVDIGANCGLFARQVLNSKIRVGQAICIEPDPGNFLCMQRNLERWPNTTLCNIGLGDKNAFLQLFRDRNNHGNYSFLRIQDGPDSIADAALSVTNVEMRDTAEFFTEIRPRLKNEMLWKSDTQGYDEIIVSRVPEELWSKVAFAIIELSSVSKPPFDMAAFMDRISRFRQMHFAGRSVSSPAQIERFISEKSGRHEDLILIR